MQQGGKINRPQTPRNELRNSSSSFSSRRSQQRPNSARMGERGNLKNIFGAKTRSNSARSKPEEFPCQIPQELEEQASIEHKQGCPWQKARPRSRYAVTESSSGIMHPRPWGARNPTEIPCFCHLTKDAKDSYISNQSRRPSRLNNDIKHLGKNSKVKISELVDNCVAYMERKKLRIAESEFPYLMKKIEEKLHKFVDKSGKTSKTEHKESKKQRNALQRQETLQKQHSQKSLNKDQMMELPKPKMSGTGNANILGKLETKRYFLEVSGNEDGVPNNLRNILNSGMIQAHPTELIAMDEKQQAYLTALSPDLRPYAVKTIDMDSYTGVQLHHQAENTTLLLAANPALALRRQVPAHVLPKSPHGRRRN